MNRLRRFFHWIFFWVGKPEPEPEPIPTAPTPAKMRVTKSRDNFGALYFRQDILDRLDDYFADIKLLKRDDPDAYALHRQVGGQVSNSGRMFDASTLEPAWRVQKPSFGMVYFADTDNANRDHKVRVSSVYYQKFRMQFPGSASTVYEVTCHYIDRKDPELRAATSFLVMVDRDGGIRPLREQVTNSGNIPSKQWRYPFILRTLANDHPGETPERIGKTIFAIVANGTVTAQSGIQVRCIRDGLTASFAIDMLRTPYFFRDRIKVKTKAGFTRPIFHIVRAHERASGHVVKTHFRGLRKFTWAGTEVIVSVPGLHHPITQEFGAAAYDAKSRLNEPTVGIDEVGRAISEAMSR